MNENHANLREVRFHIVARTRSQDVSVLQGEQAPQGRFQARANRQLPGSPNDGFRRRVYEGQVRPRNVGRRPRGI